MTYLMLILGLATLIVGGEFLVSGAVGIAKKAQISTLVIGMTVISFGTSAPELIVSIKAALEGNPEIAIGNVVGSNIANIALVLGITVMIFPIVVDRNSKIIDWPMMMMASLLFYVFALYFPNGEYVIDRWEGMILFGILVVFTTLLIRNSRKKNKSVQAEDLDIEESTETENQPSVLMSVGKVLIGLVGLYFGAEWLLSSSIELATQFGMSKSVIGITIVAFGTSVPELVTSAVAAFKKETDISIGNLIGSNLFNIMAVVGVTSMVKPIQVDEAVIHSDMIWMLAISLGLMPLMLIGKKLSRVEGFILFTTYVTYITLLVMSQK